MPVTVSAISVTAAPYDNSGILAASGSTSGAYPGPWRIETQTLNIEYIRHPYAAGNFAMAGSVTSLSGVHSASADVDGTYLLYKVTAERKVQKSYDIYDTSTYVQNQTFKIFAESEDLYGNTYGDLSAGTDIYGQTGSQFALGPMGLIATEEPYYNRRLWDDNIDATSVDTFEGTSRAFYNFSPQAGLSTSAYQPWSEGFTHNYNYTFISNSLARASFKEAGDGDMKTFATPNIYIVPEYTTTKESDWATIDFINKIGQKISTSQYNDFTAQFSPLTLTGFFRTAPQPGVVFGTTDQPTDFSPTCLCEPISSYDWHRHNFS